MHMHMLAPLVASAPDEEISVPPALLHNLGMIHKKICPRQRYTARVATTCLKTMYSDKSTTTEPLLTILQQLFHSNRMYWSGVVFPRKPNEKEVKEDTVRIVKRGC
jgi:hypothetical protein